MTKARFTEILREYDYSDDQMEGLWAKRPDDDLDEAQLRKTTARFKRVFAEVREIQAETEKETTMAETTTAAPELIKVHVTQTQREYLEFLVARRVNDLERREGAPNGLQPSARPFVGSEELRQLRELQVELRQAGT